MMRNNDNYKDSINDSLNLFNKRMLNYRNEKLFLTNYSIKESKKLEINSLKTIKFYKNIYK
jgi:hypothetical protein